VSVDGVHDWKLSSSLSYMIRGFPTLLIYTGSKLLGHYDGPTPDIDQVSAFLTKVTLLYPLTHPSKCTTVDGPCVNGAMLSIESDPDYLLYWAIAACTILFAQYLTSWIPTKLIGG